jgi:hypothetical protein
MTVRDVIRWLIWIFVLALAIKFAWSFYQSYRSQENQTAQQQEVPDIDKECKVIPDTGQCFCRHRRTNERLKVPYRECVALAGRR